jgi:iron(III) transport system permease protein
MAHLIRALTGFSKLQSQGWEILAIAIAVIIATPVLAVVSGLGVNASGVWQHLAATVLTTYITNSLLLMVGVGVGVTIVGTGTAWLVTMCRFPGQRWLTWALLLPLAAPAYVLAYTYTDFLDYYGVVQTGLRALGGWQSSQDYWFPKVRSLPGAIVMLTLVLYPYVYLLARSAFLSQSVALIEASRSLGCQPGQSFVRVALPLARPAIATGLALALMETLNDYATVQFFAVDTFTTGIYRTWINMGERPAAMQLSALLLAFVLVLVWLEQWSRGQTQYYQTSTRSPASQPYPLQGLRGIVALFCCLLPLILGFLLPAGILLQMALGEVEQAFDQRFWELATNSLTVASGAAVVTILVALLLAYGLRLSSTTLTKLATQIAAMGYAVPGSVIAVGILVPLGRLDNAIADWVQANFQISTGLLLSGTLFALIFAYLVRFLALSLGSVSAGLIKIKPSLDEAARSLGNSPMQVLLRVHIPLLWKSIFAAAILVFVDVMKELSATFIIRPFNFDTLAIHVYNLAADERLAEASGAALAIVLVGLIPVILLSRQMEEGR